MPTTEPLLLMPKAWLKVPPRVPRAVTLERISFSAASRKGTDNAVSKVNAVMHNVLDFKLSPSLPSTAEYILSRTFAGLVLWCPEVGNVIPRAQSPPTQLAKVLSKNDWGSFARVRLCSTCTLSTVPATLLVTLILAARG